MKGPIGIVGALRWELSPLVRKLKLPRVERAGGVVLIAGTYEKQEVVLAIGGIGQKQASQASQVLVDRFKPRVLISAGFAGAVDAALRPGDLVLGERLIRLDAGWSTIRHPTAIFFSTPALMNKAEDEAVALGLRHRRGALLSLDVMLTTSGEKQEAARSGALALEMESTSAAQVAIRCGLPFLAVRSISDAFDQDLGLDFNKRLDGRGRLSYSRILAALLAHPSALPSLWRLKRAAHQARRSLATFLFRFLPQLDPPASALDFC
ncbi:MAG: 5'-methylthioadenosine/S-adenosylhomocysteine nucleosidase [Candidatus Methylomirabilales bacterium]